MTPAELAGIRNLAAFVQTEPCLAGTIRPWQSDDVILRVATRNAVCEVLTALADEIERLQSERDSTRHALQQIASAGRVWLEACP